VRQKKILITGGTGFVGSNLANHLAKDNVVIVLDNGYLGTSDNLDDEVTYSNKSVLDDTLPTDVDVVFHLAALSSYEMHETEPSKGARVNVEGFVNTVEQAKNRSCRKVL